MKLFTLVVAFLLAIRLVAMEEVSEKSPRMLIHLLDYIAMDYAGAVEHGRILKQEEFNEQIEFSGTVVRVASELKEMAPHAKILGDMKLLEEKIRKKEEAEYVSSLARKISQAIVVACKVPNVPRSWPNLHKGRKLFDSNCSQCHGMTGKGDGPSSGTLDPKPVSFHGDKMADSPPFQLFNAIHLGVPGTAMAAFPQLSDGEVWDLAFYAISLRHGSEADFKIPSSNLGEDSLELAATLSDKSLTEKGKNSAQLRALRLTSFDGTNENDALATAVTKLRQTESAYLNGQFELARTHAIFAYLNGVEPVEPRLRAKDFAFTQSLEKDFADVRAGIEKKVSADELHSLITKALGACEKAGDLLKHHEGSAFFTFSVAAGIFLREGFEAALILITLLGVVRSVGASHIALSIHAGWISAMVFGVIAWFFSGWILSMSGMQREMLEGVVSGVAVVILLYFGFWLHRKTEIGRWRIFINEMTDKAVSKKSFFALGSVAFLGVFRECFETVLFLRALVIESGPRQSLAMLGGVLASFVAVLVFSFVLVRQSAKVPVRRLFQISSLVLVLLSLILIGKMMHSFQESGIVGVTPLSLPVQSELLGFFPTLETLVPQVIVFVAIILIGVLGNQLAKRETV